MVIPKEVSFNWSKELWERGKKENFLRAFQKYGYLHLL